jgi:hypothetical protein
MSLNYVPLNSAAKTFDAVFHDPDTANIHNANSTPTFNVFQDASDTPILASQSMTQRSGFTGCYRGTFTPSAANGFTLGSSYNIHVYGSVTGTVSGNTITDDWVAMTFVVSAAETSTGSVPATVAGSVGSVTGSVGGSVASVTGSVGSVVDISTSANTELTSVPASTATLRDMMKWVFLLSRNRITQTATTQIAKANDGATSVGSSTVSDDGTTAVRGVFL